MMYASYAQTGENEVDTETLVDAKFAEILADKTKFIGHWGSAFEGHEERLRELVEECSNAADNWVKSIQSGDIHPALVRSQIARKDLGTFISDTYLNYIDARIRESLECEVTHAP